jgi:hypothetical protein
MHRFRALESIDLSYTYEPDGVGYGGGGTHWHITRSRGVTCAGLQRWFSACITEGVSLPLKNLRLSHRKLQTADWLGQLTALRAKIEALDVSHTGLSADVLMLGVARLYKVSPCLHTLRMAALPPGDHGVVQEFALACTGIRVLDLSNHNVLSDARNAASAACVATWCPNAFTCRVGQLFSLPLITETVIKLQYGQATMVR